STFAKPRAPACLWLINTVRNVTDPVALTRCNNSSRPLNLRAIASLISSAWAATASPSEMNFGGALWFPIAFAVALSAIDAGVAADGPLYRQLRYDED